jgi:hypothetical protein
LQSTSPSLTCHSHALLAKKVEAVVSVRANPPEQSIGKSWTHCFVERHSDEL